MLAIIIVTYNSHATLPLCLESISRLPAEIDWQVFVIENHSPDRSQTATIVKKIADNRIRLVQNQENLGFAKAVNQGIRLAEAKFAPDYFLLLNPDAVCQDSCIKSLLKAARGNNFGGLFSALIQSPTDKRPWFAGGKINWIGMRTVHADLIKPSYDNENLSPVILPENSYLTGCCLLVSKSVVDAIGFFDEQFFLYYEDADYSLRAAKAGIGLAIVPDASCLHSESQSSTTDQKIYHLCLSGLIFFDKHLPKFFKPYFHSIYWIRYLYHRFITKKTPVLQALIDFRKR